jgi:hypothetical protein
VLGIKEADKIVKLPEDAQPMDPVSENMAILNGLPAKAFIHQDHQAHLQVHMAMVQDPSILEKVGQSPAAGKIQGAMSAHIAEHLAFAYRSQIEQKLGIQLPPPGEPLPPEVEGQLAKLVAEAAQMVLAENQGAAAQKKAEETVKDPIFQLQKEKNENQRLEVMRKMQKDKAEQVMGLVKIIADNDQEVARLAVEMYKANQGVDVKQATNAANAGMKLVDIIARSQTKPGEPQ